MMFYHCLRRWNR